MRLKVKTGNESYMNTLCEQVKFRHGGLYVPGFYVSGFAYICILRYNYLSGGHLVMLLGH